MKKEWTRDILYILLAFSFCFMFEIQRVFVANFFFVLLLLFKLKKVGISKISLVSFFAFMTVVVISTVAYIGNVPFEARNLLQTFFNVQYLFLLFALDFDNEKLDKYIHFFSVVIAVWVIIAFLYSGTFHQFSLAQVLVIGRQWGKGFLSGWPNETVLPILYGLFLNLLCLCYKFSNVHYNSSSVHSVHLFGI